MLSEREASDSKTLFDAVWLTNSACCSQAHFLSLIYRVRPGGGILITDPHLWEETPSALLAMVAEIQAVCRLPHLFLALRKVAAPETELARLVARYAPRGWNRAFTRTVDLLLGGLGLVVSLPLMAGVAALILLTSRGPALMRQVRVKQGGELFTFYKFRTMPIDSKLRFPAMYAYEYSEEDLQQKPFKVPEDPRNTPIGRFIRRFSIDELPNLINCVRGDISLVGPRPDLPEMISYYTKEDLAVLAVKPGITGAAQVSGRGDLCVRSQLAIDREYVLTHSLWRDATILMKTVMRVLRRVGAY